MAHKDHEKMIGSYKSEVGKGGAATPGREWSFCFDFQRKLEYENLKLQRNRNTYNIRNY